MTKNEPKLYHLLPANMIGPTLYPLRKLALRYPETYGRAIGKYDDHPDRQGIPHRAVPPLGCSWQDVVQCCPVHPHLLFLAWQEAGVSRGSKLFIEIPRSRVENYPSAVFERNDDGREVYTDINWETFSNVSEVSAATRQWYTKLASLGRKGADFVGVPHVMIKGEIDISGLRVIDWTAEELALH